MARMIKLTAQLKGHKFEIIAAKPQECHDKLVEQYLAEFNLALPHSVKQGLIEAAILAVLSGGRAGAANPDTNEFVEWDWTIEQ